MRTTQRIFLDKAIKTAVWALFAILYVILVYQLMRKLAGGSWSVEEITLTTVTVSSGAIIAVYAQLTSTVQKLSGSFEQFEKRFERLEQRVGSLESPPAVKQRRQ